MKPKSRQLHRGAARLAVACTRENQLPRKYLPTSPKPQLQATSEEARAKMKDRILAGTLPSEKEQNGTIKPMQRESLARRRAPQPSPKAIQQMRATCAGMHWPGKLAWIGGGPPPAVHKM